MSHSNGIIYIDTSTTPNEGVSIADIQSVLGSSANDIGALITNGAIKMWAKYKPVRNSVLGTYDQLEEDTTNHIMKWKNSATWWKGDAGVQAQRTCGIVIPTYANIGELIDTADVWEYQKPRGFNGGGTGFHEWFRFLDFNLYNHNAVCPFSVGIPDDGSSETTTRARLLGANLILTADVLLPDYNLKLTDIGNFDDLYFGVVVVRGQQAKIKTNSAKLGVSGYGDTISLDGCGLIDSAGDITIYAVLVPTVQSSWESVYEHTVMSLNSEEGKATATVTLVASQSNVHYIDLAGFVNRDARSWDRIHRSATVSNSNIWCNFVQNADMSTGYDLTSITWKVAAHSAPTVIVSQGTLSAADLASAEPNPLEAECEVPGSSLGFRAPYVVDESQLPRLTDDYYEITYTFNYTPY